MNSNSALFTPATQLQVESAKSSNSKGLLILLVVLEIITLLVAGYFGYQYSQLKKQVITAEAGLTIQETQTSVISPTQVQISTTTSIDNTWNLYTNNRFGFSFKLPKTASEFGGKCANGKLDVDMVPVKTFDDDQGTYVTYEYFYEYPINNVCQKTINDLNTIQRRTSQWNSGNGNNLIVPSNWHIVTAKVENDSELENFIKTNYGIGCKLGVKSLSPTGVYDVKIQGDGLDLDVSKCQVNFVYALKYSPEIHKVATWGVGQDVVFSSLGYKQTYDSEMINSFKFTN